MGLECCGCGKPPCISCRSRVGSSCLRCYRAVSLLTTTSSPLIANCVRFRSKQTKIMVAFVSPHPVESLGLRLSEGTRSCRMEVSENVQVARFALRGREVHPKLALLGMLTLLLARTAVEALACSCQYMVSVQLETRPLALLPRGKPLP
jgi:hypothetical protein